MPEDHADTEGRSALCYVVSRRRLTGGDVNERFHKWNRWSKKRPLKGVKRYQSGIILKTENVKKQK